MMREQNTDVRVLTMEPVCIGPNLEVKETG